MAFPIFLILFIVFWTGDLLFGAALVYHVREYSLPGHRVPKIFTAAFIVLSSVFFLLSVFFLWEIYRMS